MMMRMRISSFKGEQHPPRPHSRASLVGRAGDQETRELVNRPLQTGASIQLHLRVGEDARDLEPAKAGQICCTGSLVAAPTNYFSSIRA